MPTWSRWPIWPQRSSKKAMVSPSSAHRESPLLLGHGAGYAPGTYRPEEIRFATRHVVEKQGGTFLHGQSGHRHRSREQKSSFWKTVRPCPTTCSPAMRAAMCPNRPIEAVMPDIFTVKPIERLMEAKAPPGRPFRPAHAACGHRRRRPLRSGGGRQRLAAGNHHRRTHAAHHRVCRQRFMSGFPASVRQKIVSG
jgi:hypothetical protein